MKFSLEVGDTEKHRLDYNYNQLLGSLTIKVDEKTHEHTTRFFNEPVKEVHVVAVGENEKHVIRIERQRKGLIGYRGRVFVNNRLTKVLDVI